MARTASKTTTPAPEPLVNVDAIDRLGSSASELVVLQDEANNTAQALAVQLGYEGSLTVGTLEDEIRFYQRRSVEALLEVGKRLLLLQGVTPRGEFDGRIELLGFSRRTAYRFMQAAAKTSKSANLALLSTQVKSASAFLELVTHDDDVLQNIADMDDLDRMSTSELRDAVRQSVQEVKFAVEKREKAELRADMAEKKLAGKRPVIAPLDERITPFQLEIAERQDLIEKGIAAHHEAAEALDAWWTEEVTQAEGYDPTKAVPLPRAVALVAMNLQDGLNRLAEMVGAAQHAFEERFGDDLAGARQYLMATPEAAHGAEA